MLGVGTYCWYLGGGFKEDRVGGEGDDFEERGNEMALLG